MCMPERQAVEGGLIELLLSAEGLKKNYGSRQLLDGITLYLNAGDKVGLVGVNGTGKSTLLKVLAGVEAPDEGTVTLDPNVQVSYLAQMPDMDGSLTVLEQVFSSFPADFRALNEYEARAMLNLLGISDHDAKISSLSGGQRKRVALAGVFVRPGDVLILDEPTNHLDTESVAWLEDQLRRFRGAVFMVTHDRYFLENVTRTIAELDHGHLFIYEANWSGYLAAKAARLEMAQASERKRQALLRRETEWIMRGARARSTKSVERIARYEALKAQDAPPTEERARMTAASARLGRKTIELEHVQKAYGDRTIIRDFSYTVLRDDRVGIIGPNGAGKSTLLSLIAGTVAPDAGSVDQGGTVRIGMFTQEAQELPGNKRPWDYINEIASELQTGEGRISATQMLERFLFPTDLQYAKISTLSGGERRRLCLLGVLMSAPNILLLDEPTNDLDVETLTILEDLLVDFPGAILTVSHDRYFLDKLARSIWELRGDGEVRRTVGGYTDWLKLRSAPEEPGAPSDREARGARRGSHEEKLRFSFQEKREFETIDADIAALEERLAALDQEIAQSATDYVRLQTLTEARDQTQRELDDKTERWVYLNDLAERIEAQESNRTRQKP